MIESVSALILFKTSVIDIIDAGLIQVFSDLLDDLDKINSHGIGMILIFTFIDTLELNYCDHLVVFYSSYKKSSSVRSCPV